MVGRKHSEKNIKKISGENHYGWKGDDVSYKGLHKWVRLYLPKPEDGLCELCHENPIKDSSNITGIYNREFKNWAWFCHRCNIVYDNVGARAWITRKNKLPKCRYYHLGEFSQITANISRTLFP